MTAAMKTMKIESANTRQISRPLAPLPCVRY